jgi:hypothetical protein
MSARTKQSKKSTVRKTVTETPVAEKPVIVDPATMTGSLVPMTPVSPLAIAGGVELDMKVSSSEVADVMVSDLEDQLMGLKQEVDGVLRSLRISETKIKETLAAESKKLGEGYTNKAAQELARAMKNFLGEDFIVQTKAGGLDVEKGVVTATVTVLAEVDVEKAKKNTYGLSYDTAERTFTIPVNAVIKEQIKALEEVTDKIAEQNRQADEIRRRLADLPRYARKARAEMTRMALSGQPFTGPQLLAAIINVGQKALPPQ